MAIVAQARIPVRRSPSWETSASGAPAGLPAEQLAAGGGELVEHLPVLQVLDPRRRGDRPHEPALHHCIDPRGRRGGERVLERTAHQRQRVDRARLGERDDQPVARGRGQAVLDRCRDRAGHAAHGDQHEHRQSPLGDDEGDGRDAPRGARAPQQQQRAGARRGGGLREQGDGHGSGRLGPDQRSFQSRRRIVRCIRRIGEELSGERRDGRHGRRRGSRPAEQDHSGRGILDLPVRDPGIGRHRARREPVDAEPGADQRERLARGACVLDDADLDSPLAGARRRRRRTRSVRARD